MAIVKKQYICENCGNKTSRWQGKCDSCGEWNTLKESSPMFSDSASMSSLSSAQPGKIQRLSEVKNTLKSRFRTGMGELDLVLGGGLVEGSLVLLGGDPGIGKSTLALQLANHLTDAGKSILYVSGEESAQQIKLRNQRVAEAEDILVLTETNLETIIATILSGSFDVVILDSIQTLNSNNVNGVVGGVSQLSYATNVLMRMAKQAGVAVILIGHVTKEGMLAGPKTIEHMVDVVLYLEGERFGSLRMLRSSKNRFGSVGEVGVFEMRDSGLVEVPNPSALFLEHRQQPTVGSSTTAILEGNKVLMLEVQALVNSSSFGYPKRTTSGFDVNRLQLIIAILQKNLKVNLSNQDVYVNVAGGFKIEERAADLPVALAILSSYYGKAMPNNLVACGEIGLLGEVRGVTQIDKRVKESEKLGFEEFYTAMKSSVKSSKISVRQIKSIKDLENNFK